MSRDPRDVVREGYDAVAKHYLELRTARPSPDLVLADEALADLPDGARVHQVRGGGQHPFVRAYRR